MRSSVAALSLAAACAAAIATSGARAQDMPGMPGMAAAPPAQPPTPAPTARPPPADSMAGMDMGGMTMMAGQLGDYSMMRDASGTSWQPDSTPMDGFSWASGGWTGMLHGYANLVYDHQGGPRGDTQTFVEGMLMAMAQRPVGPGVLTLRSMLSPDPAMGPAGYPLLLQTGETADGVHPLVDRQHPHDLFMELAGVYQLPVGHGASAFLYVGYPGEPALGPPTFMHRYSGMDDPAAPITHHWLDSTHISFGVVTAGVVEGPFKLEGSVFNGREPDQHRWDFDRPRLDSYSGRVSFNPTPDWAFQVSYGFIKSPEQLTPDVDQRRVTASAIYNRKLAHGNWQTTLAWGRNYDHPGHTLDGFLLESALNLGRHTIFGRAENVQKDELFQPPSPLTGEVFRVSALSLGYVYDLPVARHLALGLGVSGTLNLVPSTIKFAYGDDPTGVMPFLRLKIR
ncbi:MAG TPA: hypothetical protein VN694_10200 [Caulobacteraceae bacterium]|nr:hypothetical protein [Caulobacteraceae bacterium]